MLALKRDTERLKYREHFTNERYRELLKREEDLERAEEAHVDRWVIVLTFTIVKHKEIVWFKIEISLLFLG